MRGLLRGLRPLRWLLAPALVWLLYALRANVWFRLYPVLMVLAALMAFALSLFRTPLVETFARRMRMPMDARAIAYCRRVTCAWTAFLAAHFMVTLATVFASYEVWAFYNGCLAYVLMGAMFLGEWMVRKRVMGHG